MGDQAAEDGEDWLTELPEAVPVALTVSRRSDGTLLYANHRFGRLLGLPVEQALGRSVLSFYAEPADRAAMIEVLERNGVVEDREIRARTAGGTPLWVAVSLRPIAFRGERDALLASFYDITARKNAEHTLAAEAATVSEMERALRQGEKMATLGMLAAGVAHELNNPAAAVRRGAEHLREAFARLQEGYFHLAEAGLSAEAAARLPELDRVAREQAARTFDLDALARSDREAALEEWLDEQDVEGAWELAPALVGLGHDAGSVSALMSHIGAHELPAVVTWLSRLQPVHALVNEIGKGAGRISEIVKALKSYSYAGQAPAQPVDLREGIESTLVILRNKLKLGITVHRDYDASLPPVQARGSELDQVWTNLLDNAADAMDGKGAITIRTRRDGDWAVVEIEDDGPGMPSSVQSRIFDPFFTTKAPGKGTGLGLSTSRDIVVKKHKGEIRVDSRPGCTRFTVRLPFEQAPPAPADETAAEPAVDS